MENREPSNACPEPRHAVFLDRDGTIVDEVGFLSSPDALVLRPGSVEGLRLLQQNGFLLVVCTNQSGVARGYFTEEKLGEIHDALVKMLAAEGVRLDAIYYCPHHPNSAQDQYRKDCDCRKPNAGMLKKAARDLGIDPRKSFAIGDSLRDLAAGREIGARTVLIFTGSPERLGEMLREAQRPDNACATLAEAARWIVSLM
jgi:D-glycero-D-manno-heptose 1,7-bisphosphate phosphatase